MKTFNFFEKLWEHSRTLRRVGLVLVMCLTLGVTHAYAWTDCYYCDANVGWTSTSFRVASGGSGSGFIHMGTNHYFKFRINSKPVGEKGNKELTTDGTGVRLYSWDSGDPDAAKYTGDPGIVEVHIDQSTGDHDKDPWVWLTRPTIYVRHNWNNAGWSNQAMTDNNDGTYTYIGQYSGSNQTNVGPCSSCTSGGNTFKYFSSATLTGSPAKGDRCLFTYSSSGYRGYTSQSSNVGSLTITKLCTITYHGNSNTGGSAPAAQADIVYNTATVLSGKGTLVKTGYVFVGWNTAADGSGTFYLAGATINPTASITLYAQWLSVHTPGVYETAVGSGGYGQTLVTSDGRDYEVYQYAYSTYIYVYAGTSTTSESAANCMLKYAVSGGNAKKNWMLHSGGVKEQSSYTTHSGEFQQNAYELHYVEGNTQIIVVSGYDQFSLYGRDKTVSSAEMQIYINGTKKTLGSTSYKVGRWDLDPSTTYTIRITATGSSSNYSRDVGFSLRVPLATCTAPTALAATSPTAKGATLTVTDGEDTNDYEFYVATASTAPTAESTKTHSVTSSKSLTITNLVAGTTYYAWARSKCPGAKSDWVALGGGGTFTTSTVTVTHTLTNVKKTSGATTAGGSDYTAVFTANTGYSMPNPTVTIGGNAATSGTHYTWSVDGSVGTITIPANKINGNIAITLNSADAAPSSAVISGTYHYFPGENISLTCTPTGNNGPTTYQWYKGGKENGNAIVGATSATYTKNSCTFDDAGSYYCKVTCNATSIWAVTNSHENYDVKILRLYVNGSKGGKSYGNVDFVKVDGTTATASIALGSNWTYGFNIADGCGHYYGNNGTMQYNSYGPWVTNQNGVDCGLTTTNAATYVFTINYSNLEMITTSVTYPSANQASGKVIYFDNNVLKWTGSSIYYRIGHSSHSQADQLSLVPGTANLYKMTTREYNNFSAWQIGNAEGGNGSNKSIYNTQNTPAITASIAYEGGAVTAAAVTVTPGEDHSTGGDAQNNNNCEFYSKTITSGMKTDRVTITAPTNGTITVNYTNTSGSSANFTSGYADLAHTCIITPTATPSTGYKLSGLTVNASAHTSGSTYTVTGATTVAATFTAKTTALTLKTGAQGSGADKTGITATYDSGSLTGLSSVHSATGYDLDGYYTAGGVKVLDNTGALVHTATDYTTSEGLWKCVDASLTLIAHWTPQEYTITYKDINNVAFTGNHMPSYPTTHTYGTATTLKKASKSGYVFGGWFTASDCKSGNTNMSLGATAFTSAPTIYAKWTAINLTALENNTFYGASAMVPDGITVSSTERYYPGVSANNMFNLFGTGTSDATSGPMSSKGGLSSKSLTNADAVTECLYFKKVATVSSYVPSDHAVQFEIPSAGQLEIWANNGIYLSNGSSETSISPSSDYATATVSAGTYYLYAKNTSRTLWGIRFKETYAITYAAGTGASGTLAGGTKVYGDDFTLSSNNTAFTREGYGYDGWATSDGGDKAYDLGGTYSTNAAQCFYPHWRQKFTITYVYNGATGGSSTASETDITVTLPTPTKTNCTFDGWYVGTTKIGDAGDSYDLTADVTAYAKWKQNCTSENTISIFNGATDSKKAKKSDTYNPDYTNAGTSNYYVDGTTGFKYKCTGIKDDLIDISTYTDHGSYSKAIQMNGSGGSNYIELVIPTGYTASLSLSYSGYSSTNQKFGLNTSAITPNGSNCSTWNANASDGKTVYSATVNNITAGTYYLAGGGSSCLFEKIVVTVTSTSGGTCYYITYNGNGADGGFTNDPTAYDDENNDVTVLANGFTRTGYTFTHWEDESGNEYKPGDVIENIDDNITLTAQWAEINYFTNGASTGYWNNTSNWSLSRLPLITDPVVIQNNVTVDIDDAKALSVDIEAGNTLTINAGKALVIAETLTKAGGATAAADVIINSTRDNGTGALIVGDYASATNKATVNFETKVKRESGTGNWINQFIGSPFSDLEPYVDYALQIYEFRPAGGGNRGFWHKLSSGDGMEAFWGYNVLYNDNDYLDVQWTGTLNASSNNVTKTGSNEVQTDNLFANSWVAPIHIANFESTDFTNFDPTIYIFNAGTPQQEGSMSSTGTATDPGTYVTIPINSGEWLTGTLSVIPAMQAFFVKATGASPSIKLDYSKLVYTPALTSVDITPTRAPRRSAEVAPEVIRLHVAGENGWAENTYVLGREDFTEGYDRGWDGRYMEGEDTNPQLYTPTTDGYMAVNCVPEIEGTVVGFRKGSSDNNYIFSFDYDGDEVWYLNDQKAQKSTQIMNGQTYAFVSEAGDNAARFVISATPINKIATGCESVGAEAAKVRKVIIDDKVYIIRGGQVFDVLGKTIKK